MLATTLIFDCYLHMLLIIKVVWLLPGLTLTVAMTELATKNLISGTVRFFYGLVITLELGMGIAIGRRFISPPPPKLENKFI